MRYADSDTPTCTMNYDFELDQNLTAEFLQIFNRDCNKDKSFNHTITFKNALKPSVRLPMTESAISLSKLNLYEDVNLTYSCYNYFSLEMINVYSQSNNFTQKHEFLQGNSTGLIFFLFSDKVQPDYFRYTLITFYVGIVAVVGTVLRSLMVSKTEKIFIS